MSVSSTGSCAAVQGAAQKLSNEELAQVAKLAATDREVRTHEQAHLAAARPYAKSGASYSYIMGPDQRLYAASSLQLRAASFCR